MRKSMIAGILGGAAVCGGAVGTFIAYQVFNGFLKRNSDIRMDDEPADERYTGPDLHEAYMEGYRYNKALPKQDVTIKAGDGITLFGSFIPAEGEAVRTVLLAHGYHSSPDKDFSGIMQFYHENGCNLLAIEERSHMRSGGTYITMGVRESEDVKRWCEYLNRERGADSMPLYLHGVSMGAATVMMAQGEDLPPNVAGIIADCGFTSPFDIAVAVMKTKMKGPVKFSVEWVNLITKKIAGFDLKDKSTVDILKNAKIPMLFVHGTLDDFVPIHMTIKSYHACAAPKRIMLVDGATHAMSWHIDTERYKEAILELFQENDARI